MKSGSPRGRSHGSRRELHAPTPQRCHRALERRRRPRAGAPRSRWYTRRDRAVHRPPPGNRSRRRFPKKTTSATSKSRSAKPMRPEQHAHGRVRAPRVSGGPLTTRSISGDARFPSGKPIDHHHGVRRKLKNPVADLSVESAASRTFTDRKRSTTGCALSSLSLHSNIGGMRDDDMYGAGLLHDYPRRFPWAQQLRGSP